jgi:hypothetical protein
MDVQGFGNIDRLYNRVVGDRHRCMLELKIVERVIFFPFHASPLS